MILTGEGLFPPETEGDIGGTKTLETPPDLGTREDAATDPGRPERSPDLPIVKRKVCFVGEKGVGKTSLIRRYVTGAFEEVYVSTLGAIVAKKTVVLEDPCGAPWRVDLVILDITGKRVFLDLFKDAYFSGAAGVFAVFDLTRRETLSDLVPWIEKVREAVGAVPLRVLGNKADLADEVEVTEEDVRAVLGPLGADVLRTSAKTGENVEAAFLGLARSMLRRALPPASTPDARGVAETD